MTHRTVVHPGKVYWVARHRMALGQHIQQTALEEKKIRQIVELLAETNSNIIQIKIFY